MINQTNCSHAVSSELIFFQGQQDILSISLLTLQGVIGVIAMVGNSLVVTAVVKFTTLHSPSNFFIASLAVTDILLATGIFLEVFLEIFFPCHLKYEVCISMNIIKTVTLVVSLLHLLQIAHDRHLFILTPLNYSGEMTTTKVCKLICFSWIYGLLIGLLPLIPGGKVSKINFTFCAMHSIYNPAYLYFIVYGNFYTVMFTICIFYGRIFHVTRGPSKPPKNIENEPDNIEINTRRRSSVLVFNLTSAKMAAIIIGIRLICWFPHMAFTVYYTACGDKCNTDMKAHKATLLLGYFSSCTNFFIYAWRSLPYRRAYKELLCCKVMCVKRSVRKYSHKAYEINHISDVTTSNKHGERSTKETPSVGYDNAGLEV